MKIFFYGQHSGNSGPSCVNRGLMSNFTPNFLYVSKNNKFIKVFETFYKVLSADVVVVSGLGKIGYRIISLAKVLGKKTIYIMHGCSLYENEINCESDPAADRIEENMLNKTDLILAVSEKFSKWVIKRFPQYFSKVDYLNNGLEKPNYIISDFEKVPGSVIAVGGDRNTKNNATVCKAVDNMHGTARLTVYGVIHNSQKPQDTPHTRYVGLVPQEDLYRQMAKSEIFVLNSIFEPFSLAVIDALNCKCSILISDAVGVGELLNLTDDDVIYDPYDEEEIKTKIMHLLKYPNYERITHELDYNANSYKKAVEHLYNFAEELASHKERS